VGFRGTGVPTTSSARKSKPVRDADQASMPILLTLLTQHELTQEARWYSVKSALMAQNAM
jgi:hypothetical protein